MCAQYLFIVEGERLFSLIFSKMAEERSVENNPRCVCTACATQNIFNTHLPREDIFNVIDWIKFP